MFLTFSNTPSLSPKRFQYEGVPANLHRPARSPTLRVIDPAFRASRLEKTGKSTEYRQFTINVPLFDTFRMLCGGSTWRCTIHRVMRTDSDDLAAGG